MMSDIFERARDLIADQKASGALCEAEAAGAEWAVDVLQRMARAHAKRAGVSTHASDDDFHDFTAGAVFLAIEDAQDTAQRIADALAALRAVVELGPSATALGAMPAKIVAMQLVERIAADVPQLLEELKVATVASGVHT